MNASDIVNAKQNKVLYNAYYQPRISFSSITSTIRPYSSIVTTISSGQLFASTSYISCNNTTYNTVCTPTFTGYDTLNQIKTGAYECGTMSRNSMQLAGVPTPIYTFSTVYSTLNGGTTPQPYSFIIASTTVSVPTGPLIVPQVSFYQGCGQCSAAPGCRNCQSGL